MTDTKLRGGHRALATKILAQLDSLIKATIIEEFEVKAAITELKYHKDKILSYDEKIHVSLDEENLLSDMEESSRRRILIEKGLAIAEDCLVRIHSQNSVNFPRGENSTQCLGIKLPTINLPTFSGNPLEFSHFWDIFTNAVHSRTDISDAQKFVYLTGQLKDEASELLDGFTTTDAHYMEAVNLLRETFGDPKRIIQSHLHALFDLKGPGPNADDLSKFRSTYECHLRGLKVLGTKVDDAGFVLCALLLRKLPPSIRDNINRAARSNYWDLEEFRKAINAEIILLQSVEPEEKISKGKPIDTSKRFFSKIKSKHNYKPYRESKIHEIHPKSTISNLNVGITENSCKRNKPKNLLCRLCFRNHHLKDCDKYPSPKEKSERAKDLNLCSKCLTNTHVTGDCFSQYHCSLCKGNHNTALCYRSMLNPCSKEDSKLTSTIAYTTTGKSGIALPTAIVTVEGNKKTRSIRALFDQGSQRSFLLSSVAKELGLKPKGTYDMAIDGFNSEGKIQKYYYVDLKIQGKGSPHIINAILVDSLPTRINMPGISAAVTQLKELDVDLADPDITDDCVSDIAVLIGSDYYFNFVKNYKSYKNIQVIHSLLGDMVVGKLPVLKEHKCSPNNSANIVTVLKISNSSEMSLNATLEKFWSLDSIGINPNDLSSRDSEVYQKFKNSLKFENGHYVASLPWKYEKPNLPHNYFQVRKRLNCVLNQLRKNNLLKVYNDLVKEQLQKDFIEEVNDTVKSEVHYIPHLAVMKDSRTTPVRMVFDCSFGNPSLNDCLLTGPSLTNDLGNVLLKFRCNRYACVSDIEKAFLSVYLNEKDRDFTRFLWPKDPFDTSSPLMVYRFKVVLFGATCSPFLLNATIKHHLERNESPLAKTILQGLYVDNLIYTTDSEILMLNFYNESKSLLSNAGLNLREWATNSRMLNEVINNNNDCVKHDNQVIKVLGMKWDLASDRLHYPNKRISSNADTKRKILMITASVFDPLGYLLPVTIKSRIFMQNLWKLKVGWDETLSTELQSEWQKLAHNLSNSLSFSLPRQAVRATDVTIHAFSDASCKAYGTALYVVSDEHSDLLIAKAKVSPIKTLTIPQMELTAAVLSSRLLVYTLKAFEVSISNVYFWTDSQIVLRWLNSKRVLKPYIQNRVDEIKKLVPNSEWHFLPSEDNPSDLITRGMSVIDLDSKLWRHGPSWLVKRNKWPTWNIVDDESESLISVSIENIDIPPLFEIERFSSLTKVLKVTAKVFCFVSKLKNKLTLNNNKPICELNMAELHWVKFIQAKHYVEAITFLERDCKSKMPNLVRQLRVFLDDDGVLRCRQRLDYSHLEYNVKYPVLLPNNHYYTKLLILHYHSANQHLGTSQMVSTIRQKWWFPRMRQTIKSILRSCIICKKILGTHYKLPPTPPLPRDRLTVAKPFTVTGIDYTGALYIKEERKLKKVYILLFTCASTRAVHLELTDDITCESFLRAFRRFISRRSTPSCIYSDNAPTFVKASNYFVKMYNDPATKEFLSRNRIQWKFIPSRAPWYGGFWERLIGLTKNSLKKTLGNSLVSRDELFTVLTEIERNINNRPLTYVSDDINDLHPLTPSDLLYGFQPGENQSVDKIDLYDCPINKFQLTKRQKYINSVISHFWTRWLKEYVTSIRTFHYHSKGKIPQLGDVVQVKEEVPRHRWKLGKVVQLFRGRDGHVRSAEIETATGKSIRPIIKLYPLEISDTI